MKNNSLKAIILAAGKGTRMKSDTPKVLHEIFSKSLLQRVIDEVLKSNIDEVFTIVGHQSDNVEAHVKSNYEDNVKCILQSPQLGTGDAVAKAIPHLENFKGNVIILCGDTPLITSETLNKFINHHKEQNSALSVMSAIFEDPTNYGRIIRKNDSLEKIVEQKDTNKEEQLIKEVNAGIYCINWDKISPALNELSSNNASGEYYLTDIIEWAVKKELKTCAYTISNNTEIFGINSKANLAEATAILNKRKINNLLDKGITIISPETTFISPETSIEKGSVIYPNCYIDGKNEIGTNNTIGPNTYVTGNIVTKDNVNITQSNLCDTTIGKDSSIGPFARLRGNVEIAQNVRIGNFVEIKNAKIGNNTNSAHLSYIGDAILGSEVNIGAGTITANYNPLTKVKSQTIMENKVKVGSNSVIIAPVTLKEGANIAASSTITKDIEEYSLAITRAPMRILKNWVKRILNK